MKEVTWNGEKGSNDSFIVTEGGSFNRGVPKSVPNHVADALKKEKNFTIRDTRTSANSDKKSSSQASSGGPGGSGNPKPDASGTGTGAASKGRTP